MSRVQQRLMQFGWWDLALKKSVSEDLYRHLIDNPWGEIYITSKRFPRPFHTKEGLQSVSQFTGVLWTITRDPVADSLVIAGPSNTAWLGDPDKNRGDLRKTMVTFDDEPVADAVTSLLPPSVTAGTIQAPTPGQQVSTKHYLEPTKTSIQMIADLVGGEWRMNPDATVDFGSESQLGYVTTPIAVVFPRSLGGSLLGLPILTPTRTRPLKASKVETLLDVQDYITEALIVGEGGGTTIWLGEGFAATVPYKDPNGNELVWRETFNIPVLRASHADEKAQQVVDDAAWLRQTVTLDLSDFVIGGSYGVGDYLYIYDPPMLQDPAVSLPFGSGYIHPATIRLLSADWGINRDMGVYFRDHTDTVWDLSDLFVPDEGPPKFEVGEFKRSAIDTSLAASIILSRLTQDDGRPPATPTGLMVEVYSIEGVTGSLRLSWDSNKEEDLRNYVVRYRRAVVGTQWSRIPIMDPDDTEVIISELLTQKNYGFQIRAVDVHGNRSAWSSTVLVDDDWGHTGPQPPPKPTVTAVPGGFDITFNLATWGPANPEAKFIRVYAATEVNPTHRVGKIMLNYDEDMTGTGEVTLEWRPNVVDGTQKWRARGKAWDFAGNASHWGQNAFSAKMTLTAPQVTPTIT